MITSIIIYFIAILFILLWGYIAFPKFFKIKYSEEVLESQIIPKWTVRILKWLLPISEIMVMLFLILPKTRLTGLYCSFALMLVYTIYVGGIMYKKYMIGTVAHVVVFLKDLDGKNILK